MKLLFDRLQVEKHPAHDTVDLRAQLINMVFVGDLHLSLTDSVTIY
jgi:hypothetical protein